jgi:hypothetical protein
LNDAYEMKASLIVVDCSSVPFFDGNAPKLIETTVSDAYQVQHVVPVGPTSSNVDITQKDAGRI